MPTLTSRAADANPVVGPCAEIIAKDKCTVEFGPSGNVMKFGGIEHGGLESNPDIAGLGVSQILCHLLQCYNATNCFLRSLSSSELLNLRFRRRKH